MKSYKIIKNRQFVGRNVENAKLSKIVSTNEAKIIVVYGRRRIGKTELIEQFFRKNFVWKFEGIQSKQRDRKPSSAERQYQITNSLRRFARYMENPSLAKTVCTSWTEFFEILDPIIKKLSEMVLYFEEIQWLSNYSSEFLAEMKPFWDDSWRHHKGLTVVICGSAPSFITKEIIADKALYARSIYEIHLQEFNLVEMSKFMKLGPREVMLAQLTVGGIPEYLKLLKNGRSVFLALCENAFLADSFFSLERDKIFISSLRGNSHYRSIVEYLSRNRYGTREQIRKAVRMKTGGSLSILLKDLEGCGFIEIYTPLHLGADSINVRYCISDEYLQFYFKFVHPVMSRIKNREFLTDPARGLNMSSFRKSLGFSFERWCRKHNYLFAKILGFDRIEYKCGAFYNRKAAEMKEGFQIDLAYIRKDSKVLICENKYADAPVGTTAANEVQRKVNLFQISCPKYRNYTFETVLITTEGEKNALHHRDFFDHVITFEDIFDSKYW